MKKLDDLYSLAKKDNISITKTYLAGKKGVSVKLGTDKHIGINNNIVDHAEETCVLAEEMGHCQEDQFYLLKVKNSKLQKMNVSRVEHKAHMWAVKYMVPIKDLKNALQLYRCEDNILWHVSEELDTPINYIQEALEYYSSIGELENYHN